MKLLALALLFNLLDLVSGIIYAAKGKCIMSTKLRNGLFKKSGFLLVYIMTYLIYLFGRHYMFPLSREILPTVVSYVVLTEMVSIIENIHKINPDIMPDKLMSLFNISEDK